MFEKRVKRVALAALIGVFTLFTSGCQGAGHLEELSSMSIPWSVSTGVVLNNGMVLLLRTGAPNELYNPTTHKFSQIPPMSVERYGFTASLLPDGKVLIAGGEKKIYEATASTEIYDPQKNSFTPGPNLLEPRTRHSAITLPNGNVLFVGGQKPGKTPNPGLGIHTVELFETKTSSFERVGETTIPGQYVRALLLKNNKVLVSSFLDGSLQIYNPKTQAVEPSGTIPGV